MLLTCLTALLLAAEWPFGYGEKTCVTWRELMKLDCGLKPSGILETRRSADIRGSKWSIGCETMDRDYADWDAYKALLPSLGAKHARFFSGWAKTEKSKGAYDFGWLDAQLRECAGFGVKPWVCISYGNPVWGSGHEIGTGVETITRSPEAFEAWLRYVRALVVRYADIVDEWEVWNEPFNQGAAYAELFYRTARAIREVQPAAQIWCTSVNLADYKLVLDRLKSENALDLASRFLYHPYQRIPEETYEDVKQSWGPSEPALRKLIKGYSPAFEVMQGEVGCPSQLEFVPALAEVEWTEYSQAKWNLRRALGDAVRGIPSSVFTMIDLKYPLLLQSFGLVRGNLFRKPVYRRPSFHAMQHVFSYFDDEVHPKAVSTTVVNGKALTVARFERQSTPIAVLWFSGAVPGDTRAYERGDVAVPAELRYGRPVWVDLLTGKICEFPKDRVVRKDGRTVLKGVPLWDSPVMIAESGQVPRRTVWQEMTPVEIVDAIHCPRQDWRVKPNLTNETWRTMPTKDFLPCFDRYGQFKHRSWPGKTTSDADLAAAREAEEADLAAHPGPTGRTAFGGWAEGPQLKATGRFRTEKVKGKWWLVDPEGRLFWSWGPVRVTPSSGMTPLNGNTRAPLCGGPLPDRDCLFEDLPKPGSPFAAFYGTCDELLRPFYLKRGETRWYDFSAANLRRKYGENWFDAYSDVCHRRLRSWGCNTIANSSDLRLCLQDRTPYAERVECRSRPIAGSWGNWFKFRDPFDASFKAGCRAELEKHGREAHDPWCIGFFIDNEIEWGRKETDLAEWTLRSPDDQPAKVEFLKRLAANGIDPKRGDAVPETELCAFTRELVDAYFRRTREAVKETDRDLLYLGCRFACTARPWVIGACVKYCDVVSYNIYENRVDTWRLPDGLDAPVLVGEFHFGAHDRGPFGSGLLERPDQESRAAALGDYVESALKNPQLVGAHWHQYSDQPASGRFDGEFLQVGWTDICDQPYPETVRVLRRLGDSLYASRCEREAPSVHTAKVFSQIVFGDLTDANRARYLEDVKAAGVDCVFLSFGDYFQVGDPRRRFFERLGREIRFFETNGLAVAVWMNGFGYGNRRTGIAALWLEGNPTLTAFSGRLSGASCPTGSPIRRGLIENARDAARAGARMILVDDDFVQSVRPGICCVCSNHLARYAARVGRPVTTNDVCQAFTGAPNALRRAVLDVSGEIATDLAREMRAVVDEVDPSIGMGLCASYTHWDVEGVDLERLLSVFAGRNRRFFRVSGAPYWGPKFPGQGLDSVCEFVRQQAAWCRDLENTTVFDENDPYPRKVASVPAWKCELYDKVTLADGVLGRHKYMLCYGADRSEPGYLEAHLANRPDDAKLSALFAGTESFGVRALFPRQSIRSAVLPVPYRGDYPLMARFSMAHASTFLVRNGLPVRHEGRGVSLVFGQAALGVKPADLEDGLVVDREAAGVLRRQGIDPTGPRVRTLDIDGCEQNFAACRSRPLREAILRAVKDLSGRALAVRLAADAKGVYSVVRCDPANGEYAVLLENLSDVPVDVTVETDGRPKTVGSLRGNFREEPSGLVLPGLAPHGYAAVRFRLNR